MADTHENAYDEFAEAYAAMNETGSWNAHYERPATLALAGEVAGLRVLDAGCGPGILTQELTRRGATVTGVDASEQMLGLARRRLGGSATFARADLGKPLPFADASFDLVTASLVMHYIEDWSVPLGEFRRVLTRDGRLVFSTHHPTMDFHISGADDYFATYQFDDEWFHGDIVMKMRFWHRPLRAMTRALGEAGFGIDVIDEPDPEESVRESEPRAWESLSTKPAFLFFRAFPRYSA